MDFFKKQNIRYTNLVRDVKNYIKKIYNQSEDVFTSASPYGQLLDVQERLMQENLFYIEDSITELSITSAQRANSIYGLARLAGYDPMRATAAMGEISIVPTGVIPENISGNYCIIPNFNSLLCQSNGLHYLAINGQNDLKIDIYNDRSVKYLKIIQGKFEEQTFTGKGAPLQSFEANQMNKNMIDHFHINVYVNGEKWKKYDSLIDIPYDTKGYLVKTGMTSGIDVIFGNKTHGAIPDLGAKITVQYLLTDGYAGNVSNTDNIEFKFVDNGYDVEGNTFDLNDLFYIKVSNPIVFGSSSEDINMTKLLAPLQSRSFVLAQTSNYRQFFEQMKQFSRINIWTETDKFDPYIDLVIFAMLVPDISKSYKSNEDYFSLDITKFALSNFEKYSIQNQIERSGNMIMGSILHFEEPVFKRYMLNIYMNTFSGYDKQKIQDEIRIRLSNYMTAYKRVDYLPKSDLIAIIESVPGIDSVSIEFISEDVEKELRLLCDYDNFQTSSIGLTYSDIEKISRFMDNYSWYEQNTYVFDNADFLQNDLNLPTKIEDLNINTKLRYILSLETVQNYIKNYIDYNGDIILQKNEIPLIRGNWYDRYGRIVRDSITTNLLSSVNFYFKKENSEYLDYFDNKILVSSLRNDSK